MNHLLITSCSQLKCSDPGRMAAYLRYEGPAYRVLRNWLLRGGSMGDHALTVLIVSARYGLFSAEMPIPLYDQRMAPAFAALLKPATGRYLATVRPAGKILINVGRDYRAALPDELPWPAQFTQGAPGERLAQLKRWLDHEVGIWTWPRQRAA